MPSPVSGTLTIAGSGKLTIAMKEVEERAYEVEHTARLNVENGQKVSAGDFLTEGSANPQDILRISGREAVHRYMVNEVQRVYRSQGVTINAKHIEIMSARCCARCASRRPVTPSPRAARLQE